MKDAGLKVTAARLGLLDVLKHAKKPLSIKDIANALEKKIDLATFYRNMELLAGVGLVEQVRFLGRGSLYELAGSHHHHIICERCGKISNVKKCQLALEEFSVKNSGFAVISRHSLEFFGVCKKCSSSLG